MMKQWFTRLFERRALGKELFEIFNVGPSAAGVVVSPEKAVSVPAIFAAMQRFGCRHGSWAICRRRRSATWRAARSST